MSRSGVARAALACVAFSVLLATPPAARAQVPGEVANLAFSDEDSMTWSAAAGADHYHVYRGDLERLASTPGRCHGFEIAGTAFSSPATPDSAGYFYLVTAESSADGEGSAGSDSGGTPRPLLGSCDPVMRAHVQNRLGTGPNPWTRDQIETLGIDGYIAAQLDPDAIDEASNTELNSRLASITPPVDIFQLVQRQVVQATYSRRQLEQDLAAFWANHFNTYWEKLVILYATAYPPCPGSPACDPNYPELAQKEASLAQYNEMEDFRRSSFRVNFRQMAEQSMLSPAMILYLDTYSSVVGAPNENFPRELMELHTMGVGGGYTQTDVEELSRVFTGWSICKKQTSDLADPLAPCIAAYWEPLPDGAWVPDFDPALHDCTTKTLFAGTPQQTTLADTCATPNDGVDDVFLALDAIVAHPATPRFISTKMLEHFVTDEPDTAMVDAVVAVWNDGSNPEGVGDMLAVVSAVVGQAAFLDPDRVGSKVKTPLEHFVSAFRAVEGVTDGIDIVANFLILAQHIPHFNETPTGYDEAGEFWIDTTNTLERQNFGLALALLDTPTFGSNPIAVLLNAGVSTAPGNAEAIVDFFAGALFAGALSPAEHQRAVDFLNTNDLGSPAPYNDVRIRQLVGFLLGYPQFQEQ